jgi:hypothetical protein
MKLRAQRGCHLFRREESLSSRVPCPEGRCANVAILVPIPHGVEADVISIKCRHVPKHQDAPPRRGAGDRR